jgi:hypothetical protein
MNLDFKCYNMPNNTLNDIYIKQKKKKNSLTGVGFDSVIIYEIRIHLLLFAPPTIRRYFVPPIRG